jgi:hypothetical protein
MLFAKNFLLVEAVISQSHVTAAQKTKQFREASPTTPTHPLMHLSGNATSARQGLYSHAQNFHRQKRVHPPDYHWFALWLMLFLWELLQPS